MFDRHLDRRPAGSTDKGRARELWGPVVLTFNKQGCWAQKAPELLGGPKGGAVLHWLLGLMIFRCLCCDVSVHPLPVILGAPTLSVSWLRGSLPLLSHPPCPLHFLCLSLT